MEIREPADCPGALVTLFILFVVGVDKFIIPLVDIASTISGLIR